MAVSSRAKQTHRFIYLATAFITLVFMGLIYAWSLFVEPIEASLGWDRAETSLIFTLSMISFSLGMIAAGSIEQRFGPRAIMLATAAIIAVGFVAASHTAALLWIYLTYGIVVGFGVGVGTDCVMSVALKWYPDKQGIASGSMLLGFGMGAMILSPAVTYLLDALGWQSTFLVLGVAFGGVMAAAAFILKLPASGYAESFQDAGASSSSALSRNYSPAEMVKTRSFWTFFLWLILVSSGGLALISQAVPAALEVLKAGGMDAQAAGMLATMAMGGISLCNGFGRFFNGFVWDKLGYRACLAWVSIGFIASMLLCALAMASANFVLIVAGFMMLGLVYGGNMCTMATMSSGFFGVKHFGMNYAVATLQMIASASLGPLLLAQLQLAFGSYSVAFWAFLGIAVAALGVALLVKAPEGYKGK